MGPDTLAEPPRPGALGNASPSAVRTFQNPLSTFPSSCAHSRWVGDNMGTLSGFLQLSAVHEVWSRRWPFAVVCARCGRVPDFRPGGALGWTRGWGTPGGGSCGALDRHRLGAGAAGGARVAVVPDRGEVGRRARPRRGATGEGLLHEFGAVDRVSCGFPRVQPLVRRRLAMRRDSYQLDWSGLPYLKFLLQSGFRPV